MAIPNSSTSDNLKGETEASIRKLAANAPEDGESLKDLDGSERITIQATKLRKIQLKNFYRVLYPEDNAEIALIINPNISNTLARAALTELIYHAGTLQKNKKTKPSLGALIFLEYQDLINKHGWKTKDVMEQVTYDFNVTWLMMKKEKPGSDLYKYAQMFRDGLIEYIKTPDSRIPKLLDFSTKDPGLREMPLPISNGFYRNYEKSHRCITDTNQAWEKICDEYDIDTKFTGVLISFWCVSYLSKYWEQINTYAGIQGFKRKHRDELIAAYIKGIEKYLPKLYEAGEISPRMLENFLKYVMHNFSRYT